MLRAVSPQFAGFRDRKSPKKIEVTPDGEWKVPNHVRVPYIQGDGIGREIMPAARQVVNEAVKLSYGDKKSIQWIPLLAGEEAIAAGKDLVPEETVKTIDEHHIAVKGPLGTPVGGGTRSINVHLRKLFDLYANIRPVQSLPEVKTPSIHENLDVVIFRENTEDVYRGIEFEQGSKDAKDLIDFLKKRGHEIPDDSGIGIKPMSEANSKRIIEDAITFALENNRKAVTVVHKGNIMKYTEGAFKNWAEEVAREKFADRVIFQDEFWNKYGGDFSKLPEGKVVLKDRIADAMLQDVLLNPHQHDVVVAPNLNGDYLSDAFAGLVGGIGLAPGANIGKRHAIFEAVHGTAPDIAGQGKANPTALILSMRMMLRHLGWDKAATLIQESLAKTLSGHRMTGDLARHIKGIKPLSTGEFTEALIANMKTVSEQLAEEGGRWRDKFWPFGKGNKAA